MRTGPCVEKKATCYERIDPAVDFNEDKTLPSALIITTCMEKSSM